MGLISEFKDFAVRGNVIDIAVGMVVGAAFGKIVTSFVNDVLMPPIGTLLGGVDFKDVKIHIKDAVLEGEKIVTPAVDMNVGIFLNTVIDFVIVAFAIFIVVKALNSLKKKKEEAPAAPAEPSDEIKLLTEIRDALKRS